MKNDKIVDAYNAIQPNADAKNRIRAMVMQQAAKPNRKHPIYKRAIALVMAAAVVLFAVFGANRFNQTSDIFSDNLFVMRAYAMELQPDGTYAWREIDITQLDGWGEYYDGEVLYIGLGLWFEFEGENIRTVELLLNNGFFATQDIGNRGAVPNTPSFHAGIPPYFTTSRLVMYGFDFDKIGDTITFDNTMPDDILLFWGSHNMSYNDWLQSSMVIEIDVKVTFKDGETHNQQLVLDFYNRQGGGIGWFEAMDVPDWRYWRFAPTNEQAQYLMNAPLESFQLISESVMTIEREYVFSIDDYTEPIVFIRPRYFQEFLQLFDENGIWRHIEGVRNNEGFILVIQHSDNEVLTGMVYVVSLKD